MVPLSNGMDPLPKQTVLLPNGTTSLTKRTFPFNQFDQNREKFVFYNGIWVLAVLLLMNFLDSIGYRNIDASRIIVPK